MPSTELAIPQRASLPDKLAYARALATADLLPGNFKKQPANVLWAVEYAEALRLPTIAAITGVHVMDGKPTPSAALMSALVRRAGHKLRIKHEPATQHGVCGMVWCEIIRADDPFVFRTEWTVERAAEAELCEIKNGKPWHRTMKGKTGNWQKYPVAMMKARALAECARDACEEALMGMHYTAEELGADVDVDGDPIIITATAARADEADADEADAEPAAPEPDWDALIAEVQRTGNITPAWKLARQHRPDDNGLRERIQAAGQAHRAKPAADEVVDAEIVEDEPAQPATETPTAATSPSPNATSVSIAADNPAREELENLDALIQAMALDRDMVAAEFAKIRNGDDLWTCAKPAVVKAFRNRLDSIDPTKLKRPVGAQA